MRRCAASPASIFQTAQSAGLDDLDDELVLHRASEQGRILVSHDKFHSTHRSGKLQKL
jgi:predicted nuclease of predicted toxin-antitoxin system